MNRRPACARGPVIPYPNLGACILDPETFPRYPKPRELYRYSSLNSVIAS